MKRWTEFLNEGYEFDCNFTIYYLSEYWGNLDQVLTDLGIKTIGKYVSFSEYERGIKKIKVKEVICKRVYKKDLENNKRLFNYWFFIDDKDNEYQITINHEITVYRYVSKMDPYGEEDWDE